MIPGNDGFNGAGQWHSSAHFVGTYNISSTEQVASHSMAWLAKGRLCNVRIDYKRATKRRYRWHSSHLSLDEFALAFARPPMKSFAG